MIVKPVYLRVPFSQPALLSSSSFLTKTFPWHQRIIILNSYSGWMPSWVPGCVSDPKPSMFLHSLLSTLITHCPPSFGVGTLCRLPGGSHIYLPVWRRKVANRRFTRLLLPPRLPGCCFSCPPTPSSCGSWASPLTPQHLPFLSV